MNHDQLASHFLQVMLCWSHVYLRVLDILSDMPFQSIFDIVQVLSETWLVLANFHYGSRRQTVFTIVIDLIRFQS